MIDDEGEAFDVYLYVNICIEVIFKRHTSMILRGSLIKNQLP
ncbi:MAG: hypothetical protein ACJATI_002922 [Halioglobus sp.]|jgi:hypothetical protein